LKAILLLVINHRFLMKRRAAEESGFRGGSQFSNLLIGPMIEIHWKTSYFGSRRWAKGATHKSLKARTFSWEGGSKCFQKAEMPELRSWDSLIWNTGSLYSLESLSCINFDSWLKIRIGRSQRTEIEPEGATVISSNSDRRSREN
jgi:hypothetical protein